MALVPPTFRVHVGPSRAPDADRLIGAATGSPLRALRPTLVEALTHLEATVRGFADDPLHPAVGRDRFLAEADRSLDVVLSNGAKLSAFDALAGRFMIHLSPPPGSRSFSQHVALAPEGREAEAVVRADPHSPDAPVGFYNLAAATSAIDGIERILRAAATSGSAVDALRANALLERLGKTSAHLDALAAAAATRPLLAELPRAAQLAHDVKRAGDGRDAELGPLLAQIDAYANAGADGLDAKMLGQLSRDLETIRRDRDKWVGYHGSVSSHYFRR